MAGFRRGLLCYDSPQMKSQRTHPAVFMFLILPFGVMGGYLAVAVAYLLSKAGISIEQTAALIAIGLLPHTWKFAWAPIADTTLSRKKWYLLAGVVSAAGIWATGVFPAKESSLPMLSAVVLVSNIAVTFLGMAVESLMAYGTPENEKGRAGGWFQAGNLGGAGLGGGAGLLMAQHLPAPWMAGAILGARLPALLLRAPLRAGAGFRPPRLGPGTKPRQRGNRSVERSQGAGRSSRPHPLRPADRIGRGFRPLVGGGRRLAAHRPTRSRS